ncbi:MAG: DUF3450 domain-containing protein [Opitutales bacterium]|nr:DUF3450 domain-containing protein [Opitutales bacterium]
MLPSHDVSWLRIIIIAFVGLNIHATHSVDQNIRLLEQWIETKQDVSDAKSKWLVEKEELAQRDVLLTQELKSLEKRVEALKEINKDLLDKEDHISDSFKQSKEVIDQLALKVAGYEALLEALLPSFPQPLVEEIELQLGNKADRDKLSLSARFQAVVSSFVITHKFNEKPSFYKEVYEDAEHALQLDVIYWGMGIAYRVSPDDQFAQIGRPKGGKWLWENANEHAESIRHFINAYQGKVTPIYVKLPLVKSDD